MSDSADACTDNRYDILRRLRAARHDFHVALTGNADLRERTFAAPHLLRTLRAHVVHAAGGTPRERCARLFVLTVLLYGALDWHFAGHGIDIEADVQIERMSQNDRYGGPRLDDRLSPGQWRMRMQHQLLRFEQELAIEELYARRLLKLTALAQAALEAASRQTRSS